MKYSLNSKLWDLREIGKSGQKESEGSVYCTERKNVI